MKIALLSIAPLIWGAGFLATRWTMDIYTPLWSHGIRYLIAGLIAFPFIIYFSKSYNTKEAFIGATIVNLGLTFQTYGVKYTSLAKSGFLTAFYVLLTPIIVYFLKNQKFSKKYILSIFLAIFGVALLCNLEVSEFNIGDILTLISAVFFSYHIYYIGEVAEHNNAFIFNLAQCFFVGLQAFTLAMLIEGPVSFNTINPLHSSFVSYIFISFIILSILSSIIAFSIQVYAQKDIPAHIASLVFLLESVFAAIFGYIYFQELLTPIQLLGCIFIVIPIFINSESN